MTDGHLNKIDEEDELEETQIAKEPETTVENRENHGSELVQGATVESNGLVNRVENENPPQNAAVISEVDLSTRTATRAQECIICTDFIRTNHKCLQPCPCGYWVHYSCLMTGLQSYEASHPGCSPLGCRFCHTPYNIEPTKDFVFEALDKVSAWYGRFCVFCYHAATVVLVDSTFSVMGIILLSKVYGHKEAENMLFSLDPVMAVSICKAIPLVSIGVNFIPWETILLRFLRRHSVISSRPAHAAVREPKYRRTLFGVLVGGLLLPWYATALGVKLYAGVPSHLHRFLLGGLTFITVKGALMMYYRQMLYARLCYLSVEEYRGD